MDTLLTIVHVVVCLFLVGIVLLQHGKGADIGATFGGSSQTLFGTEGPLPLLNKITTGAAIIFMLTSVTLAYISSQKSTSSVMSDVNVSQPAAKAETAKPLAKEDKGMEAPAEKVQPVAEKTTEPGADKTVGQQQQKPAAEKPANPAAATPAEQAKPVTEKAKEPAEKQ